MIKLKSRTKAKHLPEFYLSVARTLQDASIKLGMRSTVGYIQTAEERQGLREIEQIFFPDQNPSDEIQNTVLIKASHILIDAWAGVPVDHIPPVSKLRIAEHTAKKLRDLPLHFHTRRLPCE